MHRCDLDRDSWKKKYDHQEDFHFLLASQSTVFPLFTRPRSFIGYLAVATQHTEQASV